MLTKEWWLLTYRWLFGKKNPGQELRTASYLMGASLWVALVSSALGVGALSFVRSLVTGFENQLSIGVADFFGPLSYKSSWRSENEHARLAAKLLFPSQSYWIGQALIVGIKGGRGVMVEGRRDWSAKTGCGDAAALPRLTIGQALADTVGAKLGDTVKVLLPGLIKGNMPMQVQAIKTFGLQELDERRVLLDDVSLRCYLTQIGKTVLDRPGDYIGLRFFPQISPMDGAAMASARSQIQDEIRKTLRDSDPQVKTWREQKENAFRGLGFDRAVLSVVLGLLTLAASLNVAAALFVIFFERDKDMITLRALGMSPGQLRRWIIIQGFMIGLLGSALGVGGAWAAAMLFEKGRIIRLPAEVYHIDHLVFGFQWQEQLGVFCFGIGSAVLISAGVAILLSRMKIVEVLGHRR